MGPVRPIEMRTIIQIRMGVIFTPIGTGVGFGGARMGSLGCERARWGGGGTRSDAVEGAIDGDDFGKWGKAWCYWGHLLGHN